MSNFVFTGNKGQGKSFLLAKTLWNNLRLNESNHAKGLELRKSMVMRTLGIRKEFYDQWKDHIELFDELEELINFKNCDVYCDDITLRLNARAWEMLSLDVQDWLTASDRMSCNFYATAVRFSMVEKTFRINTDYLAVVTKGMGSRRPKVGLPDPRFIWGFINECQVPATEFEADAFKEGHYSGGKAHWINKKYLAVYDHKNVQLRTGFPKARVIRRLCDDTENCEKAPHWITKHV